MRREILKLSAGWVLCAAAWAACGGEQTVTRKDLGYQITVPKSWNREITHNADTCVSSPVVAGAKDAAKVTVSVSSLAEGVTLDTLATPLVAIFKEGEGEGFTMTEKAKTKLAGVAAIKVKCVVPSILNSGAKEGAYYYLISGKRVYEILCLTEKSEFDKYAKEIDAIVSSFKIIEAK